MEQVLNEYPEAHNVQVLNNVNIQPSNQENNNKNILASLPQI